MPLVLPGRWEPRGIDELEPAAWRALRAVTSTCVVAGPGAGKTEFLAQRAAYLLETATCAAPYRILAISFKSDAAENLAQRVRLRCPPALAHRFVSLTFDAFTKNLVDRFRTALPPVWRPAPAYRMGFPTGRIIDDFLRHMAPQAPAPWGRDVAAMRSADFESRVVGSARLPDDNQPPQSAEDWVVRQWLRHHLQQQPGPTLTFVGLNRLAELLLRTHRQIRHALRVTYPFVFIDEFQDTTYAQYDFLLSAFGGGSTVLTAVGDDKQRIMGWAGARPDNFAALRADFGAERIPLIFNFRSSPDLVRIQHVVARAIDPQASAVRAQARGRIAGEVAQIWRSRSVREEVEHLAQWLAQDMARRHLTPRDYALLVRQRADNFEAQVQEPFASVGLRVRNESRAIGRTTLQDLLSAPFCQLAVGVLRLAVARRVPALWRTIVNTITLLRGISPEDAPAQARAEAGLVQYLADLRIQMSTAVPDPSSALAIATGLFQYLDLAAVRRTYPQYATGDLLAIMSEATAQHLVASCDEVNDWSACLDAFEGKDQIPLMTVHKSKGLEFDTIVFLGLDDQAWWSHRPGDREGLATFFVALSRAKQRAIFSFCEARGTRLRVAELYELLAAAGVQETPIP